jgi:hypothetical protein
MLCDVQAVWEELPGDVEYGSKSKVQKQRAFMQLVTPENPMYLHDYADSSSDMEIRVPSISGGSFPGFCTFSLFQDMQRI